VIVQLCSLKGAFAQIRRQKGPVYLVEVCAVRAVELLARLKLVYTSMMYPNTIQPQVGRNGKIGMVDTQDDGQVVSFGMRDIRSKG
jgi:hypothetical protein